MAWKYIMLRKGNYLFPVIFPDKLIHSEVAKAMAPLLPPIKGPVHAVSAGMIEHLEPDGVHGESTTLKLKSKEGDEEVMLHYSYLHGVTS